MKFQRLIVCEGKKLPEKTEASLSGKMRSCTEKMLNEVIFVVVFFWYPVLFQKKSTFYNCVMINFFF
jgi:hypothetical protein